MHGYFFHQNISLLTCSKEKMGTSTNNAFKQNYSNHISDIQEKKAQMCWKYDILFDKLSGI